MNVWDSQDNTTTLVALSLSTLFHTTTDFDRARPFVGLGGTAVRVDNDSDARAQVDRTPGGLWPSDHAGVHAVLRPAQQRVR